ncbi:MAG: DUF541 domain-containing protein [Chloroflexi bacterium]|nr:DUF541 domain-containing protein [Chloroflexota bacterium]
MKNRGFQGVVIAVLLIFLLGSGLVLQVGRAQSPTPVATTQPSPSPTTSSATPSSTASLTGTATVPITGTGTITTPVSSAQTLSTTAAISGTLPLSATQGLTATIVYTFEKGLQRTVSVSGVGQVNAQPDRAIVQLGVQSDAKTAGDAMSTNSKQMQALIDALKKAGIPATNIQTQVVNLQPHYPNQQATQVITPTITGYTALNTVSVQVDNLTILGDLLDVAVKSGANSIQNIQLVVSNPAAQLDQARAAAMRDARHKADQLATLGNAALGPVLTISESSRAPVPLAQGRTFATAASSAVPIEAGTQTVEVEVQVTWLLH